MKVVFVGGGSFRLLPILRGAFLHRKIFHNGEVRLVDLDVSRAEMVGRMVMRTPEYAGLNCKVSWGTDLDRALDGADMLYVTMAVGSPYVTRLSSQASRKRGFISSDNVSLTGAFLGLTAGPTLLDFARRMERYCPDAWMMIFANPVAVYSGMVNNHTSIKALGVCGGFNNHRWDLTRLMGREEFCDEYDVDAAGINHLSFILKGAYRGEDLYEVLGRYLGPEWKPPRVQKAVRHMEHHIHFGLRKLLQMYHRFGKIIFSTEGDGMAHLFYEEMFGRSMKDFKPESKAAMKAQAKAAAKGRKDADQAFRKHLDLELGPEFWSIPNCSDRLFGRDDHDITIPVLRALAGMGTEKIAASRPNRGAVAGFKDRTVLEYSLLLSRRTVRPAGEYEIPDCFQGLISALATHQTLLGDAIACEDPRALADAMHAYPVKQNTRDSARVFKELLAIHRDEIPAFCQEAGNY